MECIGPPTDHKTLADYDDETILWILAEHKKDTWLQEYQPEKKPKLRRYMRLAKQEAHKRGLLGT